MFTVLGDGGAIGIFPEGLSHDAAHLLASSRPARLVSRSAAQRVRGAQITIVPCGLTFINPKRFRSRVLVQYGPPLVIARHRRGREHGRSKSESPVTDEIGHALRRLTVNAPDWDTVRALDIVRRLYQPQEISIEERVELARRFNTYYGEVADDPRVVALMRARPRVPGAPRRAGHHRPRARARSVQARGHRPDLPPPRAGRVLAAAHACRRRRSTCRRSCSRASRAAG